MRSDSFESPLTTRVFALGALLFIAGVIGIVLDTVSMGSTSGLGVGVDLDLEVLGIVTVAGAVLGDRIVHRPDSLSGASTHDEDYWTVYITRPLLETLQQSAQRSEPESLSIALAATPAQHLTGAEELPKPMPVFTHLYLPHRANSVSAVFGVDLHTPPGRTHGRFVTHPFSELRVTKRDDLHEIVFVAVPPWDEDSIAAFDRAGRRHPMCVINAVPPEESLPTTNQ